MRRDIKTKAKTSVWLNSVGFILGMLAHIMTIANWLCIEKDFWFMYKCISDSNQPRVQEEDILTPLKSYSVRVTLTSPNCVYDLTKSLGQHRIYNFPFHTKDTLKAAFKGIVLNTTVKIRRIWQQFPAFQEILWVLCKQTATYFTAFFNPVLCFVKRVPCYFSFITVLENRYPWRIFYNFFFNNIRLQT